jgi:hypothetical protein
MKLVRSDSPEVVNSVASSGTLACWGWPLPILVCFASAPGLLMFLIGSLAVSVRAALWLGVPVIIATNGYLLWRGMSPRLNWVIAVCVDGIFVRLFVQRGKGRGAIEVPDVVVFEASDNASMSIRAVEVFVYGPKPKTVEWLVIEPSQVAAEFFSDQIRRSLNPDNPSKQTYVTNEDGRIALNWEWCRPALRAFLTQSVRKCPSVLIAPEKRTELALNGIWQKGSREKPNAQQRQMLVHATRLGFGCECAQRIGQYKHMSFRKASAYLKEIVQQEAGTEQPAVDAELLTR